MRRSLMCPGGPRASWTGALLTALVLVAGGVVASPPGAQAARAAQVGTGAAAASDVRQPQVREVALTGIDEAVLRAAPDPGRGIVGPSSTESTGAEPAEPDARQVDDGAARVQLEAAAAATVSTEDHPATLVAVSADAAFAPGTSIQVRAMEPGGWSDWEDLSAEDGHGPDPGSAEARGIRVGSEPLMTVDATSVQVRLDTPSGAVPAGTELTVISAPDADSDATVTAGTDGAVLGAQSSDGTVAAAAAPRPSILTRAQWGADESWRSRGPRYTSDVQAGFLHHTASTSDYTPEQTAAQIRAIYAYHTKSLGHSDIDYNFIVDRFGRLWEGRYGGMDRPVLGGHTAGFNEHTFAVVALGNFQTTAPTAQSLARMRDSVARLFAWKLGLYGVSPVGTARLVSAGYTKPTRYPKGTVAAIPTISSHQMVNYTSCPGVYLQRQLPGIRALAARYAHVVITPPTPPVSSVRSGSATSVALTSSADRAVKWRADIFSPCSTTPVRSYTGQTSGAATIPLRWDLRNSAGKALLPAAYTVRMTGTAQDRSPVLPVYATVVVTPAPGGAWGPCPNATRLTGADASATSVLWGKVSAPGSRTVVLTAPSDEGETALAAGVAAGPLARHLRAPLLLTRRSGLAATVSEDLRARRATRVIVVGDTSVVPGAVAGAVQRLGIKVTRLSGSSAAATAAAVAQRFAPGAPAVLVSPGSPAHSLAGAALAATRNNPVLLAGRASIPKSTRKALATRRIVTVAALTSLSSATVQAALPAGATWTRLTGADATTASTAIAAAVPTGVQRVVVLPDGTSAWGGAPLAAASGAPLLFTGAASVPAGVGGYLDGRSRLRGALTPVGRDRLSDGVLGVTSRLLSGPPWAPNPSKRPAFKLGRANATPEPVRKGSKISVKVQIKARTGSGGWRKAPKGTAFALQFRASGSSTYRTVTRGRLVTSGKATVKVRAGATGRWRFAVAGIASKSDRVKVRS